MYIVKCTLQPERINVTGRSRTVIHYQDLLLVMRLSLSDSQQVTDQSSHTKVLQGD